MSCHWQIPPIDSVMDSFESQSLNVKLWFFCQLCHPRLKCRLMDLCDNFYVNYNYEILLDVIPNKRSTKHTHENKRSSNNRNEITEISVKICVKYQ
jgi:hypothetical protein